jgi:glutaconyl-CoA/methylmalonyl-CoA decarboxylase subunit delta
MTITELLAQFANPETLKTLSFANKFLAGLVTTVLGMGITFIALIMLQVFISWMDQLINRTAARPKKSSQKTPAPFPASEAASQQETYEQGDDSELVAVITAVIAMKMKIGVDNIIIKNIVKIEDRSPLWNRAGIIEQMNSRF